MRAGMALQEIRHVWDRSSAFLTALVLLLPEQGATHIHVEDVGPATLPPSVGHVLARADKEKVVPNGHSGRVGDLAQGTIGPLPSQAVLDEPVGLVPLIVAHPDATVVQGINLLEEKEPFSDWDTARDLICLVQLLSKKGYAEQYFVV